MREFFVGTNVFVSVITGEERRSEVARDFWILR